MRWIGAVKLAEVVDGVLWRNGPRRVMVGSLRKIRE